MTLKGVSSINRLDEKFSLRFDKELERAYLKGMFGSIPQFGSEHAIINLRRLLKTNEKAPTAQRPQGL